MASTLQPFPSIVTAASPSVGTDESSAYEMCGNTGPIRLYARISRIPIPTRVHHRQGPSGRVE